MLTTEHRTMLALAAIAYRGFASQSESAIARKLDPWLADLPSLGLGAWRRVWGPETFRIPTSLLDDAMVYVAEEQPAGPGPRRYVVAIRGTNPASLYDWVFGDFWVNQPIAWPGETPGDAKLSGSTFLGLEIIRRLGGEEDGALPATVAGSARELVRCLERLSLERAFTAPRHFEEKLAALDLLRDRVTEAARDLFLPQPTAVADEPGTLAGFLAGVPRGSRVSVTGHSKGGALALATALWLHEGVGRGRELTVDCFSFAGPTAGNSAFARRYEAALGGRTHRIVNPLDLVPHAWASADLHEIAGRYEQLAPPILALARGVGPLDYEHPKDPPIRLPEAASRGDLHQQVIHQHLDAYLRAAGLPDAVWNTASILLGRD